MSHFGPDVAAHLRVDWRVRAGGLGVAATGGWIVAAVKLMWACTKERRYAPYLALWEASGSGVVSPFARSSANGR